jgi:hypothetical protein
MRLGYRKGMLAALARAKGHNQVKRHEQSEQSCAAALLTTHEQAKPYERSEL